MKKNIIFKKIKFPQKINKIKINNFFNKLGLSKLIEKSKKSAPLKVNQIVEPVLPEYPPMLVDLYRLYKFITLNKRTTILEFGSGWSTLIISMALNENKKKYHKDVLNLRRNNPFELFVLENKRKFLNDTKFKVNKFCKNSKSKINWHFSEVYMDQINHRYCTQYKSIPLCNPDLIYLDGPNLFTTKNKINNFTIDNKDLMPMVGDIIKIEYFLTPGTIIITDGRSANAQFLKDNFKRKWIYLYDKNFDQHIFYLNADCLGKWNKRQLKFYSK